MIHLFDLDRTLWDCQNKYEQEIWAKQLIPPFRFATHYSENIIIDDVFYLFIIHDFKSHRSPSF